MTRHSEAAGVAGLSLLAAGLIGAGAIAFGWWRTYAPTLRAWLIETTYAAHNLAAEAACWQMVVGILIGVCGTLALALAFERCDP